MTTVTVVESTSRTFAYQKKLPRLPIPSLEDTCRRYLRALEALQEDGEHEATKRAVQDFLENDGPVIHQKLKTWAKDKDRCAAHVRHPLSEFC